jgi:D-alanyl-D-alanine carboxypeptidase
MTQKARALGMANTTFRNASGLPDSGQVTTARDMLTLALRLQDDFPKMYPLFATRSFAYNGASYRNHNTLLGTMDGIDGIKTGYTRMSGFNLVTSLRRGEKHIVAAVFGGATAGTRNATMRLLLTRSLLKASTKKTRKPAPLLLARAKPAIRPSIPSAIVAQAGPVANAAARASAIPTKQTMAAAASPPPLPFTPEPTRAAPMADPIDAQPNPDPQPTVEIARVRPVMVAARVRPMLQPNPVSPAVAQAAAPPRQQASTRPAFVAQPPVTTAVTEATPLRMPQPTALPLQPTTVAQPTGIQRGSLPSTLQAQAQGLGKGSQRQPGPTQVAFASTGPAPAMPAPARLLGPDPVAPSAGPVGGGFQVQIGAYATAAEAERVLRDAQTRSVGRLKTASPLTAPVQKDNRLLYRARFAGFDARSAAATCLELRRAAIDCFVMKAE